MSEKDEITEDCPLCMGTGYAYPEDMRLLDGSRCVLCKGKGKLQFTSEQLELLDKVECLWLDPDPVNPPITQQMIPAIRRLRKAGKTLAFIAGKFGVSTVAIHKIVSGKTWKNVPDRSV